MQIFVAIVAWPMIGFLPQGQSPTGKPLPMAISLDLRRRIINTWKKGDSTRNEIAERYDVSLGMVKKLIQQDRHTGCIENLHHRAGRKPLITGELEQRLLALIREQPDATLAELQERLGNQCHRTTIYRKLRKLGVSYKKKGRGGRGAKPRGREG